MSFNLNVVNPSKKIKGQITQVSEGVQYNTEYVIINKNSVATFNFGTVVKVIGISNGALVVDKATASTDVIYGVIAYEKTNSMLVAGARCTILKGNAKIVVEASGVITLGQSVEIVPTGDKVAVKTTGTKYGIARTESLADGDLIVIEMPHSLDI
jgi:hypothetical protein